jgi:hypothetical protein
MVLLSISSQKRLLLDSPILIPQLKFGTTSGGASELAKLLGQSEDNIKSLGGLYQIEAGDEYLQDFRNAVKALEDAANNFAEDSQLEFDFGPEYKKASSPPPSVFEGFNIADLARVYFRPIGDRGTQLNIELTFGPKDTQERFDKVFAFMSFLDKHPQMVKQGAIDALADRVQTYEQQKKAAYRRRIQRAFQAGVRKIQRQRSSVAIRRSHYWIF